MSVQTKLKTEVKKSAARALLFVGLLMPFVAGAQESEGANGTSLPTIDELYLGGETTVATLRAQLRTNNLEHQMLGLAAIEDQLSAGLISPDNAELFDAVSFVMQQGVSTLSYQGTNLPRHYHPGVRNSAARVLGVMATPQARTQLVRTVDIDPDPSVRAQALYSLARIGQDPDGSVTRTIAKMMLREHMGQPDPGVMYAALVAIDSIHSNPENTIHGSVSEMVLEVAVGLPYTRLIRGKAMQVLAKM